MFAESLSEADWVRFIVANHHALASYRTDVTCWDGSRPDLASDRDVIEVDWCYKWKEGVGQAIFYSAMLNRQGSLLLLFPEGISRRSVKQMTYAFRASVACNKAGIRLLIYDCRMMNFKTNVNL